MRGIFETEILVESFARVTRGSFIFLFRSRADPLIVGINFRYFFPRRRFSALFSFRTNFVVIAAAAVPLSVTFLLSAFSYAPLRSISILLCLSEFILSACCTLFLPVGRYHESHVLSFRSRKYVISVLVQCN